MQYIPCKCNAKDKPSNPDDGIEFGLVMLLFLPALVILISLYVGYEPQNTVESILKFLLIAFGLCFIWIETRTIFGESSQDNGAGANIVLYINFADANKTHKGTLNHEFERETSTTALQEMLKIFSKAIDWSKVLEGIANELEVAFGKKGGKKIVIHL
ncbi:hypothetical protein V865_000647 [Kwoniella europaea PYCC6329]|uniref:Uncharacterized protein n=1 Tax=Kwoniella europaea PYCC6329 TaxID=1423913 RepID=A0AAX4K829_9TREE